VDWDCRMPATSQTAIEAAWSKGEARGEDSRCFESTLYNSTDLVSSRYYGCYPHRCLSDQRLQVFIDGRWRDCVEDRVLVAGWSGWLGCPPATELCASATDMRWPEIMHVQPSHGPAAGGTSITLSGLWLASAELASSGGGSDGTSTPDSVGTSFPDSGSGINGALGSGSGEALDDTGGEDSGHADDGSDGGGGPSRVVVCGVAASGVRQTNATAADGSVQLVAIAPALTVTHGGAALNLSCHISVSVGGREAIALNAFRYVREAQACTILSVEEFEWDLPHLTSLYICGWPYALSAIAALWVIRGGWKVRARLATLSRIECALGTAEVTRMRARPL